MYDFVLVLAKIFLVLIAIDIIGFTSIYIGRTINDKKRRKGNKEKEE